MSNLAQDKEVWLSRGEIEGLLQGSLTWTDVYPRPVWSDPSAQSVRSAETEELEIPGKGAGEADFSRNITVTTTLAATAVLTLVSWVYFVFVI